MNPVLQPTSTIYFRTAGMTPDAPFVGEVTILPPAALTSFTAIAYADRKSTAFKGALR